MSTYHAVVWIDHLEAHVFRFDVEHSSMKRVRAQRGPARVHRWKSGVSDDARGPDSKYFELVASALERAGEILIAGPAQAKHEFDQYLRNHRKELADNVVGVESLDHPSDAQTLAIAKRYFAGIDRMRANSPET